MVSADSREYVQRDGASETSRMQFGLWEVWRLSQFS